VLNQFGLLLVGFGGVMLILAVLLLVGELVRGGAPDLPARLALLLSGLIGAGVGGSCWLLTRGGRTHLGRREALLLVSMGWVLGGLLAALPYFMWATFSKTVHELHPFRGFENCYFEAISGLTTTGATVLGRVEDLPHSLLLWRAITQWLGGLGVIVLFVAVLPGLGVGGRKLFRVETGGASADSLQPQIRETTRTLMHIYIGLTLTADSAPTRRASASTTVPPST
jgi:trk system potassium uptake protein TrkH